MKKTRWGVCVLVALAGAAQAGELFLLSDPSGLAAEAEFTLLGPTSLQVRLRNTSTGVPLGSTEADQILTGVSWDFGAPGVNVGDVDIIAGSVMTGPTSLSLNFSVTDVGPSADVSGEYGYGNDDGTGALPNFISSNTAGSIGFGGANLDGPADRDGPQAGLVAAPVLIPLNGLGAIQDEIIATVTLDRPITEQELLADLYSHHVRVEFGSDATFLETPEPQTVVMLVLGAATLFRVRRFR